MAQRNQPKLCHRLSDEQVRRIQKVISYLNISLQAFATDTLMTRVAQIEEQIRQEKDQKKQTKQYEPGKSLLGFDPPKLESRQERLEARRERLESRRAKQIIEPIITPTVETIANVPVSVINDLALNIAKAPRWQKEGHTKAAANTFALLAKTPSDVQMLMAKLDGLINEYERQYAEQPGQIERKPNRVSIIDRAADFLKLDE